MIYGLPEVDGENIERAIDEIYDSMYVAGPTA